MKRVQVFSVVIWFAWLALWGTGCGCPPSTSRRAPKQQATNAAKMSADKKAECEQQLQQAEEQIQDLTNELRVTSLELEQEQTKTDALLEENQSLNEQLQITMERLKEPEQKPGQTEKTPRMP